MKRLLVLVFMFLAVSTAVYIYNFGLLSAKGMEKTVINGFIAILILLIWIGIRVLKKATGKIKTLLRNDHEDTDEKTIKPRLAGQNSLHDEMTMLIPVKDTESKQSETFADEQPFRWIHLVSGGFIIMIIVVASVAVNSSKFHFFQDEKMTDMLIEYANYQNSVEISLAYENKENIPWRQYYVTNGNLMIDQYIRNQPKLDFSGKETLLSQALSKEARREFCKDSDRTITIARSKGVMIRINLYDMNEELITTYGVDLGTCN